jgi:Reverse transcriptase (RNA-dependent DNA polymerase)/Zinc knuckle
VYSKTLVSAYHLLTHWKQESPSNDNMQTYDGMAFIMSGNTPSTQQQCSNQGDNNLPVTCYRCGRTGHYANQCPEENARSNTDVACMHQNSNATQRSNTDTNVGNTMVTAGAIDQEYYTSSFAFCTYQNPISLKSTDHGTIPKEWILLDNQSTINVFTNKLLLRNIRQGHCTMKIHSTGGVSHTDLVGDLPGYGTVWYHPHGIANILSLAQLHEKGYTITYSSKVGNVFNVIKNDGSVQVFRQSDKGLYFLNTNDTEDIALVNTVNDNQYKYSTKSYSQAVLARKLQKVIGRPNTRDFIRILNTNALPNSPVTYHDVIAAENIFGPDIGSLKGKTTRQTPDTVEINKIAMPLDIYEQYRNMVVAGDIMHVNGMIFLVTISRHLRFATTELLKNQRNETILRAIKNVINIYKEGSFQVTDLLMDGQFEGLKNELSGLGVRLNITGRQEHVPEIERYIRTLKERIRSVYNGLPFKSIPPMMLAELVSYCNFWLNSFPKEDGLSKTLSPRTIITGRQINYLKHCKLEFGEYVQTHEEHDNTLATRTIGAISLRPTGNLQGTHLFLNLNTGRIIARNKWTVIPMPEEVVHRVNQLGNDITLEIMDDPDEQDPGSTTDEDTYIAGLEAFMLSPDHEQGTHDGNTNDEDVAPNDEVPSDNNDGEEAEIERAIEDRILHEHNVDNNDQLNEIEFAEDDMGGEDNTEGEANSLEDDMDLRYGTRNSEYNLRPRRPRDYSHLHGTLGHICMTQYNLKKGLEKFGTAGINAVQDELRQLDMRDVFSPVNANTMSLIEKREALPYLMFLKQKRSGQIKGRGCADGRRQRLYSKKEDASSPTVAIESVFITSIIDASENRDIATVDIPGAFLQADVDEIIHIKLVGTMVDILLDLNGAKYEPCVIYENDKKALYVQLNKALYGTLRAALLFWKKLTAQLQEWGFTINPYDWCVANKMINNDQCTIIWHVDDLKISHVNKGVVTEIINKISNVFGNEAPLTINRGKVHDYLGMELDFRQEKKVVIKMEKYIHGVLEEAPNDMEGAANTPASKHLFQINNQSPEYLDQATNELFHTLVAKLLFLSKRGCPDIQLPVSFLCTRVKKPDTDDYRKLGRVIKYLRSTIDMVLTLERDNMHGIDWWVDASYGCHSDMRSQTGGLMSMGKGSAYVTSIRQKLNTKSSTEAELVAVSDVLPQIIWTRNFLIGQGIEVRKNRLYQDNRSAILLENNGRGSSSKRTRHIDIRYFFITDRINKQEVTVEYCSTERMLADFLTKPLQGSLFTQARDLIMNRQHHHQDHDATLTSKSELHRSVLAIVPENGTESAESYELVKKV